MSRPASRLYYDKSLITNQPGESSWDSSENSMETVPSVPYTLRTCDRQLLTMQSLNSKATVSNLGFYYNAMQ